MKNNLTLGLLFSTISILVAVSTITSIYTQEENQTSTEIKFFTIQHSQSGSITEINATTYSLELNKVSDKTILFSDRPDRIVTSASTSDFIGNWTTGEDSFVVNPPNAVLIVDKIEGKQNIAIVELSNPVFDSTKKTLKYDIILDDSKSIELPSEFEESTLVMDPAGNPGVGG
ncbi:MAG: hypothetical protein ACPKQO_11160 [Nitrososphaeraceae archaeon]